MTIIQLLLTVAIVVIISMSAVIWLGLLARRRAVGELLRTEPRSLVPWRGTHVAVAFFLYLVASLIATLFVQQRFGIPGEETDFGNNPDAITWLLGGNSLLNLVAIALVITFLCIDLKATLADLGWRRDRAKFDLLYGGIAFVAIAPVVYLIQIVLKTAYNQISDEPAAHPIEIILRENPTPWIIFWCFFSAIVVAPLVEEFLFRVILQGWLEKKFYGARILFAAESSTPMPHSGAIIAAEVPPPFMWPPIIISSLTFSFLHVGHGPDPIPLLLLALVLGYLYAKTHRILPCIVVHMALNGFSMLALWDGLSDPTGL